VLLPTKAVFIPKQSVIEQEIYHHFDIQIYKLTIWFKGHCKKRKCITCSRTGNHEGVLWPRHFSVPIDMVGIRQEQEMDTTICGRWLVDS